MTVSRLALGSALGLVGALIATPANLAAQPAATAQLNRAERAAIAPLARAVQARDWTSASSALPAAQSAASSAYSRYLVASHMFAVAVGRGDQAMQASALDAIIASGGAPAASIPVIYRNRAALAQNERDPRKYEAAVGRWLEVAPNEPDALLAMGEAKESLRKSGEALAFFERAIAARAASGQPVPETWRKRAVKVAYDNRLPQALRLSRELVAFHPSSSNWRDALLIYRDMAKADPAASLDALRLMRSTRALAGERDYLDFAQTSTSAGLHAESKLVLEEGVTARMIDPSKAQFKELIAASTKASAAQRSGLAASQTKALAGSSGAELLKVADATFATGNYAKAAELYGAALQKGSVDPNLVNTRLGIALGLAGQRAQAEAALRGVTGTRSDLASLWLLWLGQRA